MQSKIIKTLIFIVLILLISILFNSCSNSTESNSFQAMVIEDGFYNKVENTNLDEKKYAIEFVFFVKGEECYWGGYSIQMDSQSWIIDLYQMQILKPGEKHTVSDTFTVNKSLVSNPIVKLQGYEINTYKPNKNLYVEYSLKSK